MCQGNTPNVQPQNASRAVWLQMNQASRSNIEQGMWKNHKKQLGTNDLKGHSDYHLAVANAQLIPWRFENPSTDSVGNPKPKIVNCALLGLLLLFGWWGLFGLASRSLLGLLSFRTHSLPQFAVNGIISSRHWPTPQSLETHDVIRTNRLLGKNGASNEYLFPMGQSRGNGWTSRSKLWQRCLPKDIETCQYALRCWSKHNRWAKWPFIPGLAMTTTTTNKISPQTQVWKHVEIIRKLGKPVKTKWFVSSSSFFGWATVVTK